MEHAALAQLVERLTRNEKVAGSIPAGGPVLRVETAVASQPETGESARAEVVDGGVSHPEHTGGCVLAIDQLVCGL